MGSINNNVHKCCSFIGLSSALDGFLAYHYRNSIFDMEKNPVCLELMKLEPAYLSVFLLGKLFGTFATIGVLLLLNRLNQRMAVAAAISVASFQFLLLLYQFCA